MEWLYQIRFILGGVGLIGSSTWTSILREFILAVCLGLLFTVQYIYKLIFKSLYLQDILNRRIEFKIF